MTALTPNDRFVSLSPAAGATVLAYDFELMLDVGMSVTRVRGGVSTPLTLGVDFSFPGGIGDETGGTLTLAVASLAADVYLLVGAQPEQRLSDFVTSQKFDSAKMNADLDALTMVAQEHRRDIGRAVKAAYGTAGAEFPPAAADQVIGWNAAGTALENKTVLDLGAVEILDEDDMASNSDTKVPTQQSVKAYVDAGPSTAALQAVMRDRLDTAPYVATRTALKALDTTKDTVAILTDTLRAGVFVWRAGDLSTLVALDPGEGIWIKADAIATTAGAWVRHVDGPYNPLWFGCTIDGVASDTAFGRFIDVLVATGNPGRLPTGAITLASKVTKNIGPSALALHGHGPDISILRWTAADGGFDITSTNMPGFSQWSRQVEMRDFSLKTTQTSGGTAIKHTVNPTTGSTCTIPAHYENLGIIGEDPNADYWDIGISLVDCLDAIVERCAIKGIAGDNVSPFEMGVGIEMMRCNDCHIISTHIYHAETGIHADTDAPSFGDGLFIDDCRIVGVGTGILSDGTVANAWMGICNTHINAGVKGIDLTKIYYTPISENLVYKTHVSSQNNWVGIDVASGNFNFVTRNQVGTPGAPGGVTNFGIRVASGTDNTIANNAFANFSGSFFGVYEISATARNTIRNNVGENTIAAIVGGDGTATSSFISGNKPITNLTTATSLDTTPSVASLIDNILKTANAGATSITTFDDGINEQLLELQIGDANTTLVNGATLALLGAQNTSPPNGAILLFRKISTVWVEIGRSYPVGQLILGSYTKAAQSQIHSYNAANALVIGARIENDNGTSPIAALGFQVTDTGSGETRSAKSGFGFVRQAANGRGRLGVYVRTTSDGSDFVAADFKGGWNQSGLFSKSLGANVASAAAIVPTGNVFHVTGTTTITSVTATGIEGGTEIMIIFDGILTFTNGSNLKLAGNFVTSALDTITLVWDGSFWHEKCRSVNV